MKKTAKETLNRAAEMLAGVMEVLHWLGAAGMAALGICAAFYGDWLSGILLRAEQESGEVLGTTIATYGFEITARSGRLDMRAVWVFAIGAVVILSLMAMVCRNVRLILKRSRSTTPFRQDNVRMLREMSVFFLSIPAVSLVMCMMIRLAFGDAMEIATLDVTHIVMGVFMFCLSLAFDHGAVLESETEGLV